MGHPEAAFAFNEFSISCCDSQVGVAPLLALLDRARAWLMVEAAPMVRRLSADPQLKELRRDGRFRDKIELLVVPRPSHPGVDELETFMVDGSPARGVTAALHLGGWVLSWPCGCSTWMTPSIEAIGSTSGHARQCRHASSIDHLRQHWNQASRKAKRRAGRPPSVQRVDDAQNEAAGEVPQIHFRDGSALNIDGSWKHGTRALSRDEVIWLREVGWVVPTRPAR